MDRRNFLKSGTMFTGWLTTARLLKSAPDSIGAPSTRAIPSPPESWWSPRRRSQDASIRQFRFWSKKSKRERRFDCRKKELGLAPPFPKSS